MRGWRAGLASASHSRNSDYATRKIDFAQYSQASAAGVTGYSRADWRHAAEIDSLLRAKGLRPFFDRRSLAPGLPWLKALEQAIGAAKAAIVLIGPRGLGNTQQYERDLALIRQTRDPVFPVVPVILPETTTDPPFDFPRVLTWIDFSHVARVSDAPDVLEALRATRAVAHRFTETLGADHIPLVLPRRRIASIVF
jgi:hypothetical protein